MLQGSLLDNLASLYYLLQTIKKKIDILSAIGHFYRWAGRI